MKKFISQPESDYDRVISKREVMMPSNMAQFKRLYRAVRKLNIGRINTGSDHDCSGHLCGQYAEIDIATGKATVTLTQCYDY